MFTVSDGNYPRLETIRDLFRVITDYPRLAKDAMQALVDLGDAIKDVASVDEVQGLIVGTLSRDMNVMSRDPRHTARGRTLFSTWNI